VIRAISVAFSKVAVSVEELAPIFQYSSQQKSILIIRNCYDQNTFQNTHKHLMNQYQYIHTHITSIARHTLDYKSISTERLTAADYCLSSQYIGCSLPCLCRNHIDMFSQQCLEGQSHTCYECT
jgi:hypothetical protein